MAKTIQNIQTGTLSRPFRWAVIVAAIACCLWLPNALTNSVVSQGNTLGGNPPVANAGIPPPRAKTAADESLMGVVFSGGIMGIGIMIVLILLSIMAVYLVVDQALALQKKDWCLPTWSKAFAYCSHKAN